jgi:hypothetical protein
MEEPVQHNRAEREPIHRHHIAELGLFSGTVGAPRPRHHNRGGPPQMGPCPPPNRWLQNKHNGGQQQYGAQQRLPSAPRFFFLFRPFRRSLLRWWLLLLTTLADLGRHELSSPSRAMAAEAEFVMPRKMMAAAVAIPCAHERSIQEPGAAGIDAPESRWTYALRARIAELGLPAPLDHPGNARQCEACSALDESA